MYRLIGVALFLLIIGINSALSSPNTQETALFKYDRDRQKIISLTDKVKNYLDLKFISLTTDQQIYWTNEDVYLKIVIPTRPNQKVVVEIKRKDSTPTIKELTLNEDGLLVHRILSGKDKKLEIGEYRVDLKTKDNSLQAYTTFTVVEGSLGALSFAYEFSEISNPKDLIKCKGGWFLGNAAGIGKRWGNGLNVKNEIRYFNQNYTGPAEIKSRCYLPGCDGIEAGPSVKTNIKNGKLDVVLDVSSHSGPFEIEVITPKGSIRHLFGKSGHVERQSIVISSNFTNKFNATLAPYENTIPIEGKNIYVEKVGKENNDALELISPIADKNNKVNIKVKKVLKNFKLFKLSYGKNGEIIVKEVNLDKNLQKNQVIDLEIDSPYSFITFGGFLENNDFYEAWALVFTQSNISIKLDTPQKITPLSNFKLKVKTTDTLGKDLETWGILEVFDNRIYSKSPNEPLTSAIGDSLRNCSNYLSTWRDNTGITALQESPVANGIMYKKLQAPAPSLLKNSFKNGSADAYVPPSLQQERQVQIEEPIRTEEIKVIYCGLIKTDKKGEASINIKAPPQIARLNVRFTAIKNFDYSQKINNIDISKDSFTELNIPTVLVKDAIIYPTVFINNTLPKPITLKIKGAGIQKEIIYTIPSGKKEIEFKLEAKNFGLLTLELLDNDKIIDKKQLKLNNISQMPVTFSDIVISNGNDITISENRKVTIYPNVSSLLAGIVSQINTIMYSWFGHSEALSSSIAIRSILLKGIESKVLNENDREILKSELIKGVKDLDKVFFKNDEFIPYPNIKGNDIWTIWVVKNLNVTIDNLKSSKKLENEFKDTIELASNMVQKCITNLKAKNVPLDELGLYNFNTSQDLIPILIDGNVVYRQLTDDSVVKWYINNVKPLLDINNKSGKYHSLCHSCVSRNPFYFKNFYNILENDINKIKNYDKYRFLKAFEKTGYIYYLLLNAKALYLNKSNEFEPLFNKITKGIILTEDTGMIKGPALLGGVYSSPNTLVKFIDLLVTMAENKDFKDNILVKIKTKDKEQSININTAYTLDSKDKNITINSPKYSVLVIDNKQTINIYDYLKNTSLGQVKIDKINTKVGDESNLEISLNKDLDPIEYYAIVAIPSVLSIKQTTDLLSDYKGQLFYGQSQRGGVKLQLISVPFKGLNKLTLKLESILKGQSEGYVLIRHINNPDILSTIKIDKVTVH